MVSSARSINQGFNINKATNLTQANKEVIRSHMSCKRQETTPSNFSTIMHASWLSNLMPYRPVNINLALLILHKPIFTFSIQYVPLKHIFTSAERITQRMLLVLQRSRNPFSCANSYFSAQQRRGLAHHRLASWQLRNVIPD